jgi:hypothetical protein
MEIWSFWIESYNPDSYMPYRHMRQAVQEVPELCAIATTIIVGTTPPAWSLDHEMLFFVGRFNLLAASPLWAEQLDTLPVVERMTNLRLLAAGFHTPPMTTTLTYTIPVLCLNGA